MAQANVQFTLSASDQTAQAFAAVQRRVAETESATTKLNNSVASFGRLAASAFAAVQITQLVRSTAQLADQYNNINARLRTVVDGTVAFTTAQNELFRVSQNTRVSFAETTDLFSQLTRQTKDLGVEQKTMVQLTEGINKALIVSGATGQAASAALIQLGQGFAAGALRGAEFMSVQEQAPRVLETVRDGLNKTQGELKKMAEEGQLTAEVFIEGFLKGMGKLDQEFNKMPVTISQSMTQISNSVLNFIGKLDKELGATSRVSDFFSGLAVVIGKAAGDIKQSGLGDELAEIDKRIAELNASVKAGGKNNFLGLGTLNAEIANRELTRLKTRREEILKTMGMRGGRLEYELYGPERLPRGGPTAPTKEQEREMKAREKMIESLQDKLLAATQGERALFEAQARRIGFSGKALDSLMAQYDALQLIGQQDDEIDRIAKEFEKLYKDAERAAEAQRSYDERNRKVLEGFNDQMEAYKESLEVRNDGIFKTALQIEEEERLNRVRKAYAEAERQIAYSDDKDKRNKLMLLDEERKKMEALIVAIRERKEVEQKDMIAGGIKGYKTYLEEISNFADQSQSMVERAFRGMEDALVGFVSTGKLSFRDLANNIIQDLIRIHIRQQIVGIFGGGNMGGAALFNAAAGFFGNVGTAMTYGTNIGSQQTAMLQAQSFAGGGYTGDGARAGGLDGKGGFMAMLHPNETVVDHTQGNGSGGVVINQTINVTTGVQQTVRAEIMTLMPQIAGAAKAAVADAKLRGGSYAAALR